MRNTVLIGSKSLGRVEEVLTYTHYYTRVKQIDKGSCYIAQGAQLCAL